MFWTADTGIDGQTPVDLDDLDFAGIVPLPSWVWYQDMADFAEAGTGDRAGRRRPGPSRAGEPSAGSKTSSARSIRTCCRRGTPSAMPAPGAVQWLAGNSLIDDEAADRFLADHPDPDLP